MPRTSASCYNEYIIGVLLIRTRQQTAPSEKCISMLGSDSVAAESSGQ